MLASIKRLRSLPSMARCFSAASTFYYKDIEIQKTKTPGQLPRGPLGFGTIHTDHLLEMEWSVDSGWKHPRIVPFHDYELHPFNTTIHYAFEGFEGMKAYRDPAGKIRTFRPEKNAIRLNLTSERLCFPTFDPNEFVKCLDKFLAIDEHWVPESPSSLYVRPTIISLTDKLGVHPPEKTLLFVTASPSEVYFKNGLQPINVKIETEATRAWPGGTGDVKAGANYIMGITQTKAAAKQGIDQLVWLNKNHITEAGACNLYVYWINKNNQRELVTPILDGTLLPGITRMSILELTKGDKRFVSCEKKISVADLVLAHREKRLLEIFICGTAVVIRPVASVLYKDEKLTPQNPNGELSLELYKKLTDIQFGRVEHPFSHLVN